ncbi:MAG TPA: hypothetical protein VN715_20255 [Roseiarcus sp.]|nr:hypothetical protein [Roseiarcus sp.]
MSIVSPFHDVCIAGCAANAALNAAAKTPTPTHSEAASFAASPMRAEAAPPQVAPRRRGWRRIAAALFSLVSGPTMPHGGVNRA